MRFPSCGVASQVEERVVDHLRGYAWPDGMTLADAEPHPDPDVGRLMRHLCAFAACSERTDHGNGMSVCRSHHQLPGSVDCAIFLVVLNGVPAFEATVSDAPSPGAHVIELDAPGAELVASHDNIDPTHKAAVVLARYLAAASISRQDALVFPTLPWTTPFIADGGIRVAAAQIRSRELWDVALCGATCSDTAIAGLLEQTWPADMRHLRMPPVRSWQAAARTAGNDPNHSMGTRMVLLKWAAVLQFLRSIVPGLLRAGAFATFDRTAGEILLVEQAIESFDVGVLPAEDLAVVAKRAEHYALVAGPAHDDGRWHGFALHVGSLPADCLSLRVSDGLGHLIGLAAHEISHTVYPGHGPAFVALFTSMTSAASTALYNFRQWVDAYIRLFIEAVLKDALANTTAGADGLDSAALVHGPSPEDGMIDGMLTPSARDMIDALDVPLGVLDVPLDVPLDVLDVPLADVHELGRSSASSLASSSTRSTTCSCGVPHGPVDSADTHSAACDTRPLVFMTRRRAVLSRRLHRAVCDGRAGRAGRAGRVGRVGQAGRAGRAGGDEQVDWTGQVGHADPADVIATARGVPCARGAPYATFRVPRSPERHGVRRVLL